MKLLNNKLKTYSSGINRIHRLCDPLFGLLIFTFDIKSTISINIYLYSIIVYLIITKFLASMYGSFRTISIKEIIYDVFVSTSIIIFSLLILNLLVFDSGYINNFFILKSLIFTIYLNFSHVISRLMLRYYRKKGGNIRTIAIKGDIEFRNLIEKEIKSYPWMGYKIIAWFSNKIETDDFKSKLNGNISDMKDWLINNNPDQIFFSIEEGTESIENLLEIFGNTSCSVNYFSNWFDTNMNLKSIDFGETKLISIWSEPKSFLNTIFKDCMDKLCSLFLIIILLPIFIIISLSILITSKRNFIYSQKRVGLNGRTFKIYKFKTMNVNDAGDEQILKQATKKDKRITKIGSFLRANSLDELPQLFNVLNGSMSLVGPRPHALSHNEFYRYKIKGYMQRHRLKPGITGLAQIKGYRGETKKIKEMENRVNFDLEYINNWSLLLDLKILIKTLFLIKSKKAY